MTAALRTAGPSAPIVARRCPRVWHALPFLVWAGGIALLVGGPAVRAQLGEKLWAFEADAAIRASPGLMSDGSVVFGTMGGRLYVLKQDGTQRWQFVGTGAFQGSPAIGIDETIYIGSTAGHLYALSSGGTLQWQWTGGGRIWSSPAVAPGGTVYVAGDDQTLTALSVGGTPLWVYRADSGFEASPGIAPDGTVYAPSRDGRLHAVNSDGTLKWVSRLYQSPEVSVALGAGGVAYVGGTDGKLRAVGGDGIVQWELSADRRITTAAAVGPDGTVYCVTSAARAYAVRPDGLKLWDALVPSAAGYSSPALSADGALHFGALDGKLYALNPGGSLKWSFASSNRFTWSSPALGPDGRVYVGGDDGRLYAVRGSAGLASSTWPMYQRDARHSASGFVERRLPAAYSAGLSMWVTLQATPDPHVRFYTVEDGPPSGWQVAEVEADGYFDAANRRVRFGPFTDGEARAMRYRITPPLGESGARQFNGTSSANGAERLVGGHQVLNAAPLHPADNQPLDGWLTASEVTAYGAAWKRGGAWPLAPASIPSAYLLRAASLWLDGETYRYDTNFATAPQWWVASAPSPESEAPPVLPAGTVATNGTAKASAPLAYRPGVTLSVAIAALPASNVLVYAIEDHPPEGWQVATGTLSEGGRLDPGTGKVKWGPFFDATPRSLSYQVTPPLTAALPAPFQGEAAFDGVRGTIEGQRVLQPSAAGWPDALARRRLPAGYTPESKLIVTITHDAWGHLGTDLTIEDRPPAGWTVGTVGEGGVYDPDGTIRFGPFFDGQPGTNTYTVTPPPDATGLVQFYGTFSVDGVPGLVVGDIVLDSIPMHPADLQAVDGWLTIGELTAYGAARRRGSPWPVTPSPVPEDYVTQAAQLWLNGEAYRYSTNAGQAPLCWTTVPAGEMPENPGPDPLPPGASATNGTAFAEMPVNAMSGTLVTVSLTVSPETNVTVYAIEDSPPEGWMVVAAEGGPLEPLRGKLRWGPFFDAQPRVVSYLAQVPDTATGLAEFRGVAAFDGVLGEIAGARQLAVVTGSGVVAERTLPSAYTPGKELVVTILTTVPANTAYYVVEETPPEGWQVGQISLGGNHDSQNHRVRFGPFFDGRARTNTYRLLPPPGTSGRGFFTGSIVVDDRTALIAGDQSLATEPLLHPADIASADWRLSLVEMTAYGAAWARGTAWPVAPSRIPTAYVSRAAVLWREGERYAHDGTVTNAPGWWVPDTNTVTADVLVPSEAATDSGTAEVDRPHFCVAGEPITVSLTITPAAQVSVYAVEDHVPAGWIVEPLQITGGGVWDAKQRKVKWGPFFDSTTRILSYQATPEADAPEISTFTGGAAFDGDAADLDGRQQVFRTDGGLVSQFKLTLLSWHPELGAEVRVEGVAGEVYAVGASTNLEAWSVLGLLTNTTGTTLYLDRTATNQARRFYRAVWP